MGVDELPGGFAPRPPGSRQGRPLGAQQLRSAPPSWPSSQCGIWKGRGGGQVAAWRDGGCPQCQETEAERR